MTSSLYCPCINQRFGTPCKNRVKQGAVTCERHARVGCMSPEQWQTNYESKQNAFKQQEEQRRLQREEYQAQQQEAFRQAQAGLKEELQQSNVPSISLLEQERGRLAQELSLLQNGLGLVQSQIRSQMDLKARTRQREEQIRQQELFEKQRQAQLLAQKGQEEKQKEWNRQQEEILKQEQQKREKERLEILERMRLEEQLQFARQEQLRLEEEQRLEQQRLEQFHREREAAEAYLAQLREQERQQAILAAQKQAAMEQASRETTIPIQPSPPVFMSDTPASSPIFPSELSVATSTAGPMGGSMSGPMSGPTAGPMGGSMGGSMGRSMGGSIGGPMGGSMGGSANIETKTTSSPQSPFLSQEAQPQASPFSSPLEPKANIPSQSYPEFKAGLRENMFQTSFVSPELTQPSPFTPAPTAPPSAYPSYKSTADPFKWPAPPSAPEAKAPPPPPAEATPPPPQAEAPSPPPQAEATPPPPPMEAPPQAPFSTYPGYKPPAAERFQWPKESPQPSPQPTPSPPSSSEPSVPSSTPPPSGFWERARNYWFPPPPTPGPGTNAPGTKPSQAKPEPKPKTSAPPPSTSSQAKPKPEPKPKPAESKTTYPPKTPSQGKNSEAAIVTAALMDPTIPDPPYVYCNGNVQVYKEHETESELANRYAQNRQCCRQWEEYLWHFVMDEKDENGVIREKQYDTNPIARRKKLLLRVSGDKNSKDPIAQARWQAVNRAYGPQEWNGCTNIFNGQTPSPAEWEKILLARRREHGKVSNFDPSKQVQAPKLDEAEKAYLVELQNKVIQQNKDIEEQNANEKDPRDRQELKPAPKGRPQDVGKMTPTQVKPKPKTTPVPPGSEEFFRRPGAWGRPPRRNRPEPFFSSTGTILGSSYTDRNDPFRKPTSFGTTLQLTEDELLHKLWPNGYSGTHADFQKIMELYQKTYFQWVNDNELSSR